MAQTALGGNPVQTNGDLPAVGEQAPEFELTAVDVDGARELSAAGPEILVVTHGSVSVDGQTLGPTESAVVPAGSTWRLDGRGTAFIARVPAG